MTETTAQDPFELAQQAADVLRERTGVARHKIALTLGSGWGGAADLLGETVAEIPAHEVPGFSKPALEGHGGTLRSIRLPDGEQGPRPLSVKRVTGRDPKTRQGWWVERDNPREGVDSWHVGALSDADIEGLVLKRVPQPLLRLPRFTRPVD